MKALTVQQPWADAVLSGAIRVFMEPFAPKVRGYFLIHSGLGWDFELENWLHSTLDLDLPTFSKRSAIIGYARLISVLTKHPVHRHPRRSSHFVLEVADVNHIGPSVLAIGKRGFWPVPDRIMQKVSVPDYVLNNAL